MVEVPKKVNFAGLSSDFHASLRGRVRIAVLKFRLASLEWTVWGHGPSCLASDMLRVLYPVNYWIRKSGVFAHVETGNAQEFMESCCEGIQK